MLNSDESTETEVLDDLLKMINDMDREKAIGLLVELVKDMNENDQEVLLKDLETRAYKRSSERHYVAHQVEYVFNNETHLGNVSDISSGGVFLEVEESLSVGQEIELIIPFANNPDKKVHTKGIVVRVSEDGIGIQFEKRKK